MNSLKNNLLIQFSVTSFVIVLILAVLLSLVLTVQLNRNIDLLKQHGAAMMSGTMIRDTDPFSIPSLTDNVSKLRMIAIAGCATGFVYLYGALFVVVWKGWKTIKVQRSELDSLKAQLGNPVTASFEELRKANGELQQEIRERNLAE